MKVAWAYFYRITRRTRFQSHNFVSGSLIFLKKSSKLVPTFVQSSTSEIKIRNGMLSRRQGIQMKLVMLAIIMDPQIHAPNKRITAKERDRYMLYSKLKMAKPNPT